MHHHSSIFPSLWAHAHQLKGKKLLLDLTAPSGFQPMTLHSFRARLLEGFLYSYFLISFSLPNPLQSGFCPRCLSATILSRLLFTLADLMVRLGLQAAQPLSTTRPVGSLSPWITFAAYRPGHHVLLSVLPHRLLLLVSAESSSSASLQSVPVLQDTSLDFSIFSGRSLAFHWL